MESATKTKPRANKGTIAVPAEEVQPVAPAATPEGTVVVEANGQPAAVADPNVGTAEIAATLPPSDKLDASPAAAVVAEAAQNAAPLAVPAPVDPNAPTADQLIEFKAILQTEWIKFFRQHPSPAEVAEFVMPSNKEIQAMAMALIADDEDGDLIAAIDTVRADLAVKKAASDAARTNEAPIRDLWLAAGYEVFNNIALNLKSEISSKARAPKTTVKADGTVSKERSSTGRAGIDWAKLAPTLLKWADDNGLHGFYFVDKAAGGYKDKPHALQLRADGKWIICTPGADLHKSLPTPTDQIVDSPLYYNEDGDPIATQGGGVPNIGGPMRAFVVLMIAKDGKTMITAKDKDGGILNEVVKGAAKSIVDPRNLFEALGLK